MNEDNKRVEEFLNCLGNGKSIIELEMEEEKFYQLLNLHAK